ncbi:protein-glutamate methylesterase/protein-glutamine glutaminase [Actomonas aquatica]|uniref:Protein-glutamate methylesterase/protein-glutamine glutaminase n=1 Tax=Actomonas aquatica TaxID=2866162 RepID=A0ABZ1CDG3_9BACT|nr:chemotaxis response regulator protein-glutamate methylesterase [Opitutus sp. WL0086]WRQ89288.1 chemotaxis response regulator protein-glutamate methylesterase [Opitutus sp. WL0086]
MSQRPIRVLIVDDSAVVRRVVQDVLSKEPDIEVVGTAIDPYFARDKIIETNPDVLTLDLEMPRMDGLTFLKIVMQQRPLPVVIMSSLTQSGSHHALEALRLGAVEVLGKPNGSYSIGDLGPQLVQKIRAAAASRPRPSREDEPATSPTPAAAPAAPITPSARPIASAPLRAVPDPRRHNPKRLLLLGASTGGTEALREVLTRLPADIPPTAIVQHIPPTFSRAFAERLNANCRFEVREARDGDVLTPGLALVAPGNYHLTLRWNGARYIAHVVSGPMVWHQRPAVDVLFKSIADTAGRHAVGGVLTGMGKDGAEGLHVLRQHGARTFSQDEASCVVYGMPRAAWEAGGSEAQVSLANMPRHIMNLLEQPTARPSAMTTA